jgi:hypothetical protein
MGEQIFTMKSKSGGPSVVSDDFVQNVDIKFVTDGASQFQNFRVNFHKFHALLSTRLSQLGLAITSFVQDGFQKCSWVRKNRREFGFNFFRVIPQRW